jgi:hypothetical protein
MVDINSFVLIVQSAGSLSPYELVSQLLAICRVQKPYVLQPHSKTMGSNTYYHIASQTVPSSNSLDIYCCRKTRRMVDSYSNFFCTIKHKLSAYPRGLIYLLSLFINLRVISRTEVQMGIQGFMQPFLEL